MKNIPMPKTDNLLNRILAENSKGGETALWIFTINLNYAYDY